MALELLAIAVIVAAVVVALWWNGRHIGTPRDVGFLLCPNDGCHFGTYSKISMDAHEMVCPFEDSV
jgi:hypothetical protein